MMFDLDFNQQPLLLIWETTRSCALACRHCRAEAIDQRDPGELTTDEGKRLLDDTREMGTPLVIFTGGDPLQRDDLEELIRYGKSIGLRCGTIPATTDRLTQERVESLKAAGLDQMAISIDGSTPEKHDGFRGVPGSFEKAMQAAEWAHACELPLQVNTVFAGWNENDFDAMAKLVTDLKIVFWEVFFLVPTGRGKVMGNCMTEQYEALFAKLYDLSKRADFIIKVTEAPHYRVYVARQERAAARTAEETDALHHHHGHKAIGSAHHGQAGRAKRALMGVNAGKGFCFVDHTGNVCPSGFLDEKCGNVRETSVIDIYRNHPVFCQLRDVSLLKGVCGRCRHAELCGGSRARAWAMTGDMLAEEPFCSYG